MGHHGGGVVVGVGEWVVGVGEGVTVRYTSYTYHMSHAQVTGEV